MSQEQQPTINEKSLVAVIHALGAVFSFIPALIGLFIINNLSEKAKTSITTAFNFQLTVFILLIILSAIRIIAAISIIFLPLTWLINSLISLIALIILIFSIMAAITYYNNEKVTYPPFIVFLK